MSGARPPARQLLLLYRDILRLHRTRLPGSMRDLGDRYVAGEFRQMWDARPAPPDGQWAEFGAQWAAYKDMMAGRADLPGAKRVADDVLDGLNAEQATRLALLEREARTLGSDMLGAGTAKGGTAGEAGEGEGQGKGSA